jgi:hypothetical protein
MRLTLACIGLLAAASPALAQSQPAASSPGAERQGRPIYRLTTFNDLVHLCGTPSTDPESDAALSLCAGYISGVLDDHRMETLAGTAKARLCMPHAAPITSATAGEMLAWARENARNGDEPAAQGVVRYYAATYPCP